MTDEHLVLLEAMEAAVAGTDIDQPGEVAVAAGTHQLRLASAGAEVVPGSGW